MPASIKFVRIDPNNLGRGGGLYYRRGPGYKGKKYPGGYYSKYSQAVDKKRKSKGYAIHPVGKPKGTKIPHTSDGNLSR